MASHVYSQAKKLLLALSSMVVIARVVCFSPTHQGITIPGNSQSTRLHMSIPNAIDTATSGFASIARLPFGTIVSTTTIPDSDQSLSIKALYDIENCRDCRQVRERITELDLVVETIIPATKDSRALNDESYKYFLEKSNRNLPVMEVQYGDKGEKTLVGLDNIMQFFDDVYGSRESIIEDADEIKTKIVEFLIAIGSYVPEILRFGRGESVAGCANLKLEIEKPLILYSYEGNQFCRLVREVLTELDLPYELQSAGKGSPRRAELAQITGGSSQCPFLIDPNQNVKMAESKDIIQYLYKTYAIYTPPNEFLGRISNIITPVLKPVFQTLAPLQAGSNREDKNSYSTEINNAKVEVEKDIGSNSVVIFTYSLSPFCKEAIGVLDNLNIQYKEISLGAEWIPLLINEGGSQKRMALSEMTGQSSLPHIFVNGQSIGGLYEGLIPALENGTFWALMKENETDS